VFHYFLGDWRENADMSNVKEVNITSRRKRKGCTTRLNLWACVNAASKDPNQSYGWWVNSRKSDINFNKIRLMDQEINIIIIL